MKGRLWLILGAAAGVLVAAGHLPFFAGAGRSLAETAERLVQSGADSLVRDAASAGASRRVVLGLTAGAAVLIPGATALLLVVAARGTLRLRALIGLALVALAAASYVYHPAGIATGVLLLALAVAGVAVAFTGPFVAAPLTALSGLIGGEFLPRLLQSRRSGGATSQSVSDLHLAIFNHPGTPAPLQWVVLAAAAVPFAFAVRLIVSR